MNEPRVTLHVWRIPARRLPTVLWRMAADRGRLRRTTGVRFAKLLGTGRDRWFGPTRADATRWATLVVWDRPTDLVTTPVGRTWRALSSAYCRLDLTPIASRGTWAGRTPFEPTDPPGRTPFEPTDPPGRTPFGPPETASGTGDPRDDRMVLAITRARLRATRAARFWRAMGGVARATHQAPGLLAAFGIGEAPIGWQGTVSLWRHAHDLVEFAYRHPDHRRAIERTPTERWYAEELFARFAVLEVTGDRTVIGWIDDDSSTPKDQTEDQERKSP